MTIESVTMRVLFVLIPALHGLMPALGVLVRVLAVLMPALGVLVRVLSVLVRVLVGKQKKPSARKQKAPHQPFTQLYIPFNFYSF
ncbi:MAG TPA: hypothetical protein PLJ13_11865 [Cyclobacteriaceae bacterium]|nr:hypothetical protein [Cyclobacteriaceae bacterium]